MKIKLSYNHEEALRQLNDLEYTDLAKLLRKFKWTDVRSIAKIKAGEEIEL